MPGSPSTAPAVAGAALDLANAQRSAAEIQRGLNRFKVVPATTDALRDEAFRIRHRVFCEELTLFERRADGRETDEFDERAVHVLLQEAGTGEAVGCVRVVKGQRDNLHALLPFESVCGQAIDKSILDLDRVPRELVGEVSRLGVIGKYRRRPGEARVPVPLEASATVSEAAPNRRQFPYILVSLYLGAYAVAQREGLQFLFTFTELRLRDHLARLGIPMVQVGGPIQHKGLRVPAAMRVSSIAENLNPFVRALYEQIARDIETGFSHEESGHQQGARRSVQL
jgi:N-acyl amino acid synthase of PEP-CTERM/exosortase system